MNSLINNSNAEYFLRLIIDHIQPLDYLEYSKKIMWTSDFEFWSPLIEGTAGFAAEEIGIHLDYKQGRNYLDTPNGKIYLSYNHYKEFLLRAGEKMGIARQDREWHLDNKN